MFRLPAHFQIPCLSFQQLGLLLWYTPAQLAKLLYTGRIFSPCIRSKATCVVGEQREVIAYGCGPYQDVHVAYDVPLILVSLSLPKTRHAVSSSGITSTASRNMANVRARCFFMHPVVGSLAMGRTSGQFVMGATQPSYGRPDASWNAVSPRPLLPIPVNDVLYVAHR